MRTLPSAAPTIEDLETAVECLATVVGQVDLDRLGAGGLGRFVASVRRVQAVADAAIVRAGAWAERADGTDALEVLLGSGQVRGATARRDVTRARLAARSVPLGKVMTSGDLGADHLDVLVRRTGRLDDDHLDRLDIDTVASAGVGLPADTFDALVRRAVEDTAEPADPDDPDDHERARNESEVRYRFDERTGMGHLSGRFDPERFEAITTAIDQHMATLANIGGRAKNPNLAAEALADLICSSGERSSHLPHVTIVVDEATLRGGRHPDTVAETADGHPLADDAVARLCCDAVLRRVVLDPRGVPIDVGRTARTATPAQWDALRAVHSSCGWVGCDRPLSHCQAHHISPWEHGGATDLDNLLPLCSHHHHLVHEGRWQIELLADRAVSLTRPDGTHHVTGAPPTRRPPPTMAPSASRRDPTDI